MLRAHLVEGFVQWAGAAGMEIFETLAEKMR